MAGTRMRRRVPHLPLRSGRDRRAARIRPARRAAGVRRRARPVGLRKEHDARARRRPRPAVRGRGPCIRALAEPPRRASARRLPGARRRDRLPERQPMAEPVGGGERRRRPTARRLVERRRQRRAERPRRLRPGGARLASRRRTVGRRTATRGGRRRGGARGAARARRRADGRARRDKRAHGDRRARAPAPRLWQHGPRRHPFRARRRGRRPGRRGARRKGAAVTTATARAALSVCRDVSVRYGLVDALRSVDLKIAAEDSVALWGRSGSGKTTLLHALGGLVEPSAGTVEWRGAPLSSLDGAGRARVRAREIAYVFQSASLLPHFTAFENVAFAARLAGGAARPEELLTLVGLAPKLDALPAELSGGEAQRVAIARALAQRPRLLLCDEPTGQLDSDTSARVLDLIQALQREFPFALVLATHDADIAVRCSRLVRLADGGVAADEQTR